MSAPDELKLWKISLLSIHTAVNMRRGLELDKVTKELNYQSRWEHEGQRAHKMSCHVMSCSVMSCESSEDGTAPAEPAAGLAGVVRRGQWCEVSVDLQQESEVRTLSWVISQLLLLCWGGGTGACVSPASWSADSRIWGIHGILTSPSVPQSRRRPLLGPSPGWKRLLALSHLRYY